ncbi:MAG: GDP-L-fucose synthase [Bryobacterales bacterium]|nr:GDP-L-fucose synthase [Bryobacterales bacterium]
MNQTAPIFVAGHRGLVGSAILRALRSEGFTNLLLRTREELDLTSQAAVDDFFRRERPQYVFLAAARVGGILANNNYPAEFIHDNLAIQLNVIGAAHRHQAAKLLFLGSSCIYPKFAPQPIREEYLLTGLLEPTNEPYAIAKIAGLKTIEAYRRQYGFNGICLMPTNLYGPGDNFDLNHSHVLPALIRRFHEAKLAAAPSVTVWGTGSPRREFLHVDDLAAASLFLMRNYDSPEIVNVGCGQDVTIRELAGMVKTATGYLGELVFDSSKPDGTPRKLLDVSRMAALGWSPRIPLTEGIRSTYEWFLANRA